VDCALASHGRDTSGTGQRNADEIVDAIGIGRTGGVIPDGLQSSSRPALARIDRMQNDSTRCGNIQLIATTSDAVEI
jgi:hypothetical protein